MPDKKAIERPRRRRPAPKRTSPVKAGDLTIESGAAMGTKRKSPLLHADRARTDKSLREERKATDRFTWDNARATERKADEARRAIRKTADVAFTRDRKAADSARSRRSSAKRPSREVVAERRRAAQVLDKERRLADKTMARQRRLNDSALATERKERREEERKLFDRERTRTDRRLGEERGRTDAAFDDSERRLGRAKKVREESAAALRNRDDFLAALSHDLRSPLNVIAISAARVGGAVPEGEGSDQMRQLCGQIEQSVRRIARMVDDLLDAERMAVGRVALPKQVTDLRDVVRESVSLVEPLASAQELLLQTSLPDAPVPAFFDRERILQVLVNLLGNAVKFTPRGGKVWLVLEVDGKRARVNVSDTGPGVPQAQRRRIFQRFTQGARGKGGSGLGLYIAQRIVEAHDGKIGVEPRSGTGSTFFFTLPTKTKGSQKKRNVVEGGGS